MRLHALGKGKRGPSSPSTKSSGVQAVILSVVKDLLLPHCHPVIVSLSAATDFLLPHYHPVIVILNAVKDLLLFVWSSNMQRIVTFLRHYL
jgi:hypothetical protein